MMFAWFNSFFGINLLQCVYPHRENVEQRETKGIREGEDQVVFVVPLDPLGQ